MILFRNKRRGFTLLEAMIGIAVIAVLSQLGYAAMTVCNRNAVMVRLMTLAHELARDQIDQIIGTPNYNPQSIPPVVPAILTLGTLNEQNLPLYVDSTTGATIFTATRSTTITATGTNNVLAAVVTVAFSYHGKTYTTQMNTLRSPDS